MQRPEYQQIPFIQAHRNFPIRFIPNGKKQAALSIITIDKICTAFGITLSQFFSPSSPYPDLTPEQTEVLKTWDCLDSRKKAYLLSCMKLLRDM